MSRRNKNLQTRYGITEDVFRDILKRQGGRCVVCGTTAPKATSSSPSGWDVDFCHKTHRVMGVVCRPCKMLIVFSKADPVILVKAARYLKDVRKVSLPDDGDPEELARELGIL